MSVEILSGGFNGPPHNVDAETALLGAIMVANRSYELVKHIVRAEHFYEPINGRLYQAMADLIEAGRIADHVTMRGVYDAEPGVNSGEGRAYIARLGQVAVSILDAKNYAVAVRDLCHRRLIAKVCMDTLTRTGDLDLSVSPSSIITEVERAMKDIKADLIDDLISPVSDVMTRLSKIIEAKIDPIPTGLARLDKALDGGWRPGSLYAIEAPHGSFKSGTLGTFALEMMRQGTPFLFVTLEMADAQILARMVSAETGCNARQLMDVDLSDEGLRRVEGFRGAYGDAPAYFAHRPAISINALISLISIAISRFGIKAVFIDYWQRIKGRHRDQIKSEFLEEVAYSIADLCEIEGIVAIMASQLNREMQSFGSGGLERAAAWIGRLQKIETSDRFAGDIEAIWAEIAKTRYSMVCDIGDAKNPAWRIDGLGPVLREMGDWSKRTIEW